MKTINPGKQRKELYNAPLHRGRKNIASHLEENLLLKYDKRALPVIKGDTVKIMRGSFKGHEDKVVKVDVKKRSLEIEGITMSKADGNKIAKPIHPSNVLITKLNLTDKWRRKKLERGLSEEAKKEIEKEAQEQIKQAEEEQRRIEEEKALEEAEKEKEEEIPEEPEKPVEKIKKEEKKETKPAAAKPKAEKKTETKKTPAKKATKPKTTTKKSTPKKEPTKKKATSKSTKKKEGK
jgi:large subunit ribosomal protein L24